MGSIAVWLSHAGQPPGRRRLGEMLAAGVGRMPASTWIAAGIGMGVLGPRAATDRCRLVTDGAENVILAWDGRLDNRDEMLGLLGLPAGGDALPDSRLAKTAYQRWGEDFVTRLAGEFAFVLWDRRRRRLLAGRDPIGICPLHYAVSADRVVVASLIRQLLVAGLVSQRLNDGMIGDFLIGVISTPEETFYNDIRRVPPGTVMDFTEAQPRRRRFWFPEQTRALRYRRARDYREHFDAVLTEAVRARIPETKPVGLLLSGGIDSASVAALVAELQARNTALPQGLSTFNVTFDELTDGGERSYADSVNRRFGFDAEYVNGDQEWSFKPSGAQPALPPWDEPLGNVHDAVMRAVAVTARARGLDVVLTGDGADLLATGTYYHLLDLLLSCRWPTLLREIAHLPRGRRRRIVFRHMAKPLVFASLWSTLEYTVPSWLSPAFVRRANLEGRQHDGRLRRGWRRPSFHLELETITAPELSARFPSDQYEARRHGIELRHPFFDKRVVEFLLALPCVYKIERATPKAILRHTMRGRVPEAIRHRPHHGGFDRVLNRGLAERERALCEECLAEPVSGQLGYVDPVVLRQAYRRYLDGERALNYRIAGTLRLELWLRERAGETAHGRAHGMVRGG